MSVPTSTPMLLGPASTLKFASRLAAFSAFTVAWNAAVTRLLTSILPTGTVFGNRIEPLLMPLAIRHLTIASPPIAAAEASWPVWLMLLRSSSVPSKELVVATTTPFSSSFLTMSL